MRRELVLRADERAEQLVSASGSKVTPSGARSISIPPSETVASPATSISSICSARTTERAPLAENASGSNPLRSVNRHASWVVSGSGSRS